MLPAFAPLCSARRDVADAVASREIAHRRVVAVIEHVDPHLRAPQADRRGHRQVDDVDRFLVHRDEHVDRDPLGRCPLLAHPLVGDGPPEAERLAEVEELGRDQDPVTGPGVPTRSGCSSHPKYQTAHGTPIRISRRQRRRTLQPLRHGVPRDPTKTDIPGRTAH